MSYTLLDSGYAGFAVCPICGYVGSGEAGSSHFRSKDEHNEHLFHMHRCWTHKRNVFGSTLMTYLEFKDAQSYLDIRLRRMKLLSDALMAQYHGVVLGMEQDVAWQELLYLCKQLMLLKFNQSIRLNDYSSWDDGIDLDTYSQILWSSPKFRLSLSAYISPVFVQAIAAPYQVDFCIPNDVEKGDWVKAELIFRRFAPSVEVYDDFVKHYESRLVGLFSELCTRLDVRSSVKEVVIRSMLGASGLGRPRALKVDDILSLGLGLDLDEAAAILMALEEDRIRTGRRREEPSEPAVFPLPTVYAACMEWLTPTSYSFVTSLEEVQRRVDTALRGLLVPGRMVSPRGVISEFFGL